MGRRHVIPCSPAATDRPGRSRQRPSALEPAGGGRRTVPGRAPDSRRTDGCPTANPGRRLPLVHRLGTGHDDQPSRPGDPARCVLGGARRARHLHRLSPRGADSQPVSGWWRGARVRHDRRDPMALPGTGRLPARQRRLAIHRRPAGRPRRDHRLAYQGDPAQHPHGRRGRAARGR